MPIRTIICEQARLFDVPGHAVIGTTLDGKVVYWSESAATLFGWSAEDALGQSIATLTPALDSQAHAEEIMERLRAGQPWSGLFRLKRADGGEFTARVSDLPVNDSEGRLVGIVGVTRPAE